MKILIIHHLEAMWEIGYKNSGTSFWKLEYKFGQYLSRNHFDRVILTNFEFPSFIYRNGKGFKGKAEFYNEYPNIGTFVTDYFEYAYGWKQGDKDINPESFVEGGSHSNYVLITDWIKELVSHEVFLSGAFIGECLEDMGIALNSQKVNWKYIKELCV